MDRATRIKKARVARRGRTTHYLTNSDAVSEGKEEPLVVSETHSSINEAKRFVSSVVFKAADPSKKWSVVLKPGETFHGH